MNYSFTLSKTLMVGSAQDFILRMNPPVLMQPTLIVVDSPRFIVTLSECFMSGQDMKQALGIRGFGIDASELAEKVIAKAPLLGPSGGVSFKCWYNGDEPEGYHFGGRLYFSIEISGPRAAPPKCAA